MAHSVGHPRNETEKDEHTDNLRLLEAKQVLWLVDAEELKSKSERCVASQYGPEGIQPIQVATGEEERDRKKD